MFNNAPRERNMVNEILRLPSVKAKTGLSRSSIYLYVARGLFPPPVSLGPRSVGWRACEVDVWIADRVTKKRTADYETPTKCSTRVTRIDRHRPGS